MGKPRRVREPGPVRRDRSIDRNRFGHAAEEGPDGKCSVCGRPLKETTTGVTVHRPDNLDEV